MTINWNLILGKDTWRINTIRRVETAITLLLASTVGMGLFYWITKLEKAGPVHGITWCFLCGLLGLAFRAWQWRFDKEPADPRKDENDVPPPLPAYLIDYPIIVAINSIVIYFVLTQFGEKINFYLAALPAGVYFGSMVKLINFKVFQ